MKIAAFPAFKNKDTNPIQFLMYSEMQLQNHKVDEFNISNIFKNKYDIIHIHWPESNKLRGRPVRAVFYILVFNFLILISKIKGAKIIWTIHNLSSHEGKLPLLEAIHFKLFTRMLDGYIVMNNKTITKAVEKYPSLKRKKHVLIPHVNYKNSYVNKATVDDSRKKLGIDGDKKVFLFLGQIRSYKGIEELVSVFEQMQDHEDYVLVIAGGVAASNESYGDQLLNSINDKRIKVYFQFIPDEELQYYFNASDLVVLPYRNILNSGSLLLALSFNKPVLLPAYDSIEEIVEEYGDDWIFSYKTLTREVMTSVINKAFLKRGKSLDMSNRNLDILVKQTLAFFEIG